MWTSSRRPALQSHPDVEFVFLQRGSLRISPHGDSAAVHINQSNEASADEKTQQMTAYSYFMGQGLGPFQTANVLLGQMLLGQMLGSFSHMSGLHVSLVAKTNRFRHFAMCFS